jgi:hypothetical protein
VSPAAESDQVADEMLDHETAGCTGSACAAFAVDAAQSLTQTEEAMADGVAATLTPPSPTGSAGTAGTASSPAVDCVECLELPPLPDPPQAPPAEQVHYFTCSPGYEDWAGNYYETDCAPNHVPKDCVIYNNYPHYTLECVPVRIDPSGTVEDTNGHPVASATVTLLQSDSSLGPFTAPPSGSPIMSPSVNPETSTANGAFDWEVFAGYYQVTAQKSGCAEPGHPSRPVVSTPVFQVPPPRLDIVLTLNCKGEAPPARPKVTSLSARSGPAAGGAVIDVLGSGFTGSAVVRFGTAKAKSVQALSPTELAVTMPAGRGTVSVRVTTNGGTSTLSAADRFSYAGSPEVTRISPRQGRAAGGTTVVLAGTGFASGSRVLFGLTPATSITVVSSRKIIAIAPAGSGLVAVRVVTASGASREVAADSFGYLAKPRLTSPGSVSGVKGRAFRFTVRTTGYPFARITESGRLPAGLKFTAHANGTATISGKPTREGHYSLTITARNDLGTARQTLKIKVT